MIWLPFRCSSGLEFYVAEKMTNLADKVLVPKSKTTIKASKGKPRIVTRALAPGYVFASFHGFEAFGHAFGPMRLIKGFHGALQMDGRAILLTPMDIRALHAMEVAAAEPYAEASLKPADRVKIRRGRYGEITAIVDRLSGANVVVTFDLFGKSNTATVPVDQVEAA